jgi:hypothetical protein
MAGELTDGSAGRVSRLGNARLTSGVVAALSLVVGLGIVVIDGFLNPVLRHAIFYGGMGVVVFYGPGVLIAAGWWGLQRGQVRAIRAGQIGAAWQGVMAFAAIGVFVWLGDWLPVVAGVLWGILDFILVGQLGRAVPAAKAEASRRHGFLVEAPGGSVAEDSVGLDGRGLEK